MQSKIENNGKGEFVLTFRRAPSLERGNVLVTSEYEYTILSVSPAGDRVFLVCEYQKPMIGKNVTETVVRTIELQNIDYVYIKLYI